MCVERVSAQFGSRGVVKLPDGWVYHDNQTLDASKNAARFALHQQHRQELIMIRMVGSIFGRQSCNEILKDFGETLFKSLL